ncbi:WD repeat-containing [Pyrenophora seminiperda CCB06]|uniref:WD repeat-containing n=1 Tax=Pyrenophora seminiperda CCB06 TaxID=1302712 RepID=A0A3M7M271_9PLEO|nr:WD repeat-containing [Pyrenophora seminiperda CCB06]
MSTARDSPCPTQQARLPTLGDSKLVRVPPGLAEPCKPKQVASAALNKSFPGEGDLYFENFDAAKKSMACVLWRAPDPDATIPQATEEDHYVIKQLVNACKDLGDAKDTKDNAYRKRMTPGSPTYYGDWAIEACCWDILNMVKALHTEGFKAAIYDKAIIDAISQTQLWTFQQRIDWICMALKISKTNPVSIMIRFYFVYPCYLLLTLRQKKEKIWTIIGTPHKLYFSTITNSISNAHRNNWVKNGRAADPGHHPKRRKIQHDAAVTEDVVQEAEEVVGQEAKEVVGQETEEVVDDEDIGDTIVVKTIGAAEDTGDTVSDQGTISAEGSVADEDMGSGEVSVAAEVAGSALGIESAKGTGSGAVLPFHFKSVRCKTPQPATFSETHGRDAKIARLIFGETPMRNGFDDDDMMVGIFEDIKNAPAVAKPPPDTTAATDDTITGSPNDTIAGSPNDTEAATPDDTVAATPNDTVAATSNDTVEATPNDAVVVEDAAPTNGSFDDDMIVDIVEDIQNAPAAVRVTAAAAATPDDTVVVTPNDTVAVAATNDTIVVEDAAPTNGIQDGVAFEPSGELHFYKPIRATKEGVKYRPVLPAFIVKSSPPGIMDNEMFPQAPVQPSTATHTLNPVTDMASVLFAGRPYTRSAAKRKGPVNRVEVLQTAEANTVNTDGSVMSPRNVPSLLPALPVSPAAFPNAPVALPIASPNMPNAPNQDSVEVPEIVVQAPIEDIMEWARTLASLRDAGR